MLDTAAALFRTQGYHATGLNQLTTAGGAPKGSLYFHFPGGKEQLAAEALTASGEQVRERFEALLETAPSAADGIDAIVADLAANLAESGFRNGCPLSNVALDAGPGSEPIRLACAAGFGSWSDLLSRYLVAQGIHSTTLPAFILASIEGAILLAKTERDTAPLHAVARHLRAAVEAELP